MARSRKQGPAPQADARLRVVDSEIIGRSDHHVPVRDYLPEAPTGARPFVWVHGGGFMAGGLDMLESDAVARAIATRGRPVRAVDYRLVPMVKFRGQAVLKPSENRYPAPLHDVVDAYLALAAEGEDPILGGASAGANLVLSAALSLRDGGGPAPAGLVLAYGTFHGHAVPMSAELRARIRGRDRVLHFILGPDSLERMNLNYAGATELLDDLTVFPGGGDLVGLPPTFVLNADRDGLRASGDALVEELREADVAVEALTLTDSTHGFLDKPATSHFADGVHTLIGWLDAIDHADSTGGRPYENERPR